MKKKRLIIASPEESADILYATHFHAPDPLIYFAVGRKKGIIVPTLEYNRAVDSVKKGLHVHKRSQFGGGSTAEIVLALSEKLAVCSWEVPWDFPLKYAEELAQNNMEINCCQSEFFPKRAVKTRKEIKLISEALRVTENGMHKALEMIRAAKVDSERRLTLNGKVLTSEVVRAEIEIELLRGGANAYGTIVACGTQAAQPHNLGFGPLFAGKCIIIDIFPRMQATGYWGDMTRTVVKGKASSRVRKAFEAVKRARDESKKLVKTGVLGSKSYEFALNCLDDAGFPTGNRKGRDYGFIHGLGHGVGLEIHEYPRLSPLNSDPLAESNVVTVEPGIYYPSWGGIRLEDMVVVHELGCQTLTQFDTFLEMPC